MPKSTNPLLRRKSSSPFSAAQRTKPGSRSISATQKDARLTDTGRIIPLHPPGERQDVVSLISYVLGNAFEEMPERAAGMNSERISEVLRFRRALPPIVSVAHLHALSVSTTDTERELARMIAQGIVRKITIPGRGKGGGAVGEGIVLARDWKDRLRQEDAATDEVKEKYMALMDAYPTSQTVSVSKLSQTELQVLVTSGFLTNPAALSAGMSNLFARPTAGVIAIAGSSAAAGTLAAVGGQGAVHASGGGGSTLATQNKRTHASKPGQEMTLSLPSTGAYLKLLTEARLHLLHLLKQLSPRYREATRDMLEEKWNGNVLNDPISRAKRMRGEWSGVLPGKTKRWREFFGLEFRWVLAECIGSGLVELFDTGSVGVAVRGT